jgi:putative Holliday junction resolvase
MSRILGLDPGEARIGVALSDPTGTIASATGYLDARSGDVVDEIATAAAEHGCHRVVIGLPLRLDGSEGPAAKRSRALGEAISEATDLEVAFQDERFTTVTAEQALIEGNVRRRKRTQKRDAVAAAVMLQGYLDRQAHDGRHGDDPDPG